jgi:hypothetical protein
VAAPPLGRTPEETTPPPPTTRPEGQTPRPLPNGPRYNTRSLAKRRGYL